MNPPRPCPQYSVRNREICRLPGGCDDVFDLRPGHLSTSSTASVTGLRECPSTLNRMGKFGHPPPSHHRSPLGWCSFYVAPESELIARYVDRGEVAIFPVELNRVLGNRRPGRSGTSVAVSRAG